MSARRKLSPSAHVARDQMREVLDRLARLEKGGAVSGRVSFGTTVRFGGEDGVDVTVSGAAGGAKTVTFLNVATGSTFDIPLP